MPRAGGMGDREKIDMGLERRHPVLEIVGEASFGCVAAMAIALHVYSVCIAAFYGWLAAIVTFFAVGPAEIFWLAASWARLGTPFNPYDFLCIGVVAMYAVSRIIARVMVVGRPSGLKA
jgi:hypothetical protein